MEYTNLGEILASVSPQLRDGAARLWCDILAMNSAWVFAHLEYQPSPLQWQEFVCAMHRVEQGEPLAYVQGYSHFYGLRIGVNYHTLIPRPETEILVEQLLNLELKETARVVDLGCGSGAIACALASHRPRWQVLAVDNSLPALVVAAHNLARLGLSANSCCLASNWMQAVRGSVDAIVCNPPYIARGDTDVHPTVTKWEPHHALFADNHGLAAYQSVFGSLADMPPTWLLVEHGATQQATLLDLADRYHVKVVATFVDYAGHQRAMLLRNA